jgi:hypothetical protein
MTKNKTDFLLTIRERECGFISGAGPWYFRSVWATDIQTVWEDKESDILRVTMRDSDNEPAGFEQALLASFRTVDQFNSFVNEKLRELRA